MFWFSDHKAYGILASWPGIEPAPLALEGEVLTTGLKGSPTPLYFEISLALNGLCYSLEFPFDFCGQERLPF